MDDTNPNSGKPVQTADENAAKPATPKRTRKPVVKKPTTRERLTELHGRLRVLNTEITERCKEKARVTREIVQVVGDVVA